MKTILESTQFNLGKKRSHVILIANKTKPSDKPSVCYSVCICNARKLVYYTGLLTRTVRGRERGGGVGVGPKRNLDVKYCKESPTPWLACSTQEINTFDGSEFALE